MVSVGKKGSGFWQVGRVQKKVSEMGFSPIRTSNYTYNTFIISTIHSTSPDDWTIFVLKHTKKGNAASNPAAMK